MASVIVAIEGRGDTLALSKQNNEEPTENDGLLPDPLKDMKALHMAAGDRLMRARKSLTRCSYVDEPDAEAEAQMAKFMQQKAEEEANPSAEDEKEEEKVLLNEKEMSSRESKSSCSESEDENEPLDDLSASMSVIQMEKFALEKRRVSRIIPRCIHRTFVDPDVEQLFQAYHERQRRADLHLFLVLCILLSAYGEFLSHVDPQSGQLIVSQIVLGILCFVFIGILLLATFKGFTESIWSFLPFLCCALGVTELMIIIGIGPHWSNARPALLWLIVLTFLIFVALPLRLPACLFLSSTTCAAYVTVRVLLIGTSTTIILQVGTNLLLVGGAALLGLMSYFFADKKHRRAFLETRQSLEVKMIIEEQSKEQERLLLSVLPKHVAETMRQDLGRGGDGQFKTIYMSRHENVSILFADIVGFTAISSTYTASELVKLLNELFARFDGLAEKYHQLRIKILGDCYYCISGAPKERSDHAVLCVHMGLSMIDAIKYVRENTKSSVDMRVGIHTGAVLAGVLGQRQWQFDVYSKDVVLANKMESSGKPGHVHVSNKTLQFLGDEFEVDPAFGEKREDALRAAGLKTYFISKVLRPYKPRPSLGAIKNGTKSSSSQPSRENPSEMVMMSRDSVTISTQEDSNTKAKHGTTGERGIGPSSFKSKLQRELISRDGRKDLLNKSSPCSLWFKSDASEKSYREHRETFSGAATTALPLVLFIVFICRLILMPNAGGGILVLGTGLLLLLAMASVSAARSFPLKALSCLLATSDLVHSKVALRILWFTGLAIIAGTANFLDMYLCPFFTFSFVTSDEVHADAQVHNSSLSFSIVRSNDSDFLAAQTYDHCSFRAYYTYFTLLILTATALLAQVSYLIKSFIMVALVSVQATMNVLFLRKNVDQEISDKENAAFIESVIGEETTLAIELCLITCILVLLNRQMEKTSRVLYLWRQEVEEQKEKAADIRQRNEALVYNILPPHVATHFMGMRRKKHEELYSQSYEEVGVLFASMPNFGDFYSEESVNNQGLECLRFLNEVISDFDGEEDPVKLRWAHLSLLVDFALELIRTLQSINEQSFNHFVLRMGINHGPLTAGVIGARKPHYDIWGNTVNVASRMESTGKAGCIQVTEETTNILRHFGYTCEQRGLIAVKGKGELMTYYLTGKSSNQSSPQPPSSPAKDSIT